MFGCVSPGNLHHRRFFPFLFFVPQAHQSPSVLCIMGQHDGQCRDTDVSVRSPVGNCKRPLPVPGLPYPMVCFPYVSIVAWQPSLTWNNRFMPADALWTFAMACNVWLTFFHKYDSEQLRRLEVKYLVACYGLPFIPAFMYFFIETKTRGKIYGAATVSAPTVSGQSHQAPSY